MSTRPLSHHSRFSRLSILPSGIASSRILSRESFNGIGQLKPFTPSKVHAGNDRSQARNGLTRRSAGVQVDHAGDPAQAPATVDGFLDNIRQRSLAREGWILSLSGWRDEKVLVRWRTKANHHDVQEKGRGGVLLDYRLRIGQITQDAHVSKGHPLQEQRLDETEGVLAPR